MSGNRWRIPSQSNHQHPRIEYFPFICCWCHHSFMDIDALIEHHETHLMLLQNQVQSIYSSTFLRPQRSMNPLRSLFSLPDTTMTIRTPACNNSADLQPAGQFSLPYHQPAAAGNSSPTPPHLPFLRGSNGSRLHHTQSHPRGEHQRGTDDRRPLNAVASRQQVMRPPKQMVQQGPIEGQHERQAPPSVDETLGQNMGASNVMEGFARPEPVATDQHEEHNETLDLTLSLGGPYRSGY